MEKRNRDRTIREGHAEQHRDTVTHRNAQRHTERRIQTQSQKHRDTETQKSRHTMKWVGRML